MILFRALNNFSSWLKTWRETSNRDRALSSETFGAAIQTTDALPELAEYLIREKGLQYVLLGKIQSDPLEKRFGWYRKLAGSNYFCSVRQMLEGEKSIRLKSLVKFSNFDLAEIRQVFQSATSEHVEAVENSVKLLREHLENSEISSELDHETLSINFYVAGFIARSVSKSLKCEYCVQILVDKKEPPPTDLMVTGIDDMASTSEEHATHERFLQLINRGGLFTPSNITFGATNELYKLHHQLFSDSTSKEILLSSPNPLAVFVETSSELMKIIGECDCVSGHSFKNTLLPKIASKMFNLCTSNYVRDINSKIHEAKKRSFSPKGNPNARKIKKLQSQ